MSKIFILVIIITEFKYQTFLGLEKPDQDVAAQIFEEELVMMQESSAQSLDESILSTDVSASETEYNEVSDNDFGIEDHNNLLNTTKSIPLHSLQAIATAFAIPRYQRKEKTIQSLVKLAETNMKLRENLILAQNQVNHFIKEKEHFLNTKNPHEMATLLLEFGVSVKKGTRGPRIRNILKKCYLEKEFTFDVIDGTTSTNPEGNFSVCG